jgi:hypothetical protein
MRDAAGAAVFQIVESAARAAILDQTGYVKLIREMFEKAFARKNPLFTLPMYYPLALVHGDGQDDRSHGGAAERVVGLIRTNFKRFRISSLRSKCLATGCTRSCCLAFLQVHSKTDGEKRLERWKAQNSEILGYAAHRQLNSGVWNKVNPDGTHRTAGEMPLDAVRRLDGEDYRVGEMMSEHCPTSPRPDRYGFTDEARSLTQSDDKLQKLIRLLKSELDRRRLPCFTEFADTARYLKIQLSRRASTAWRRKGR